MTSSTDAALARNDRFLLEIIEAFSICPFARGTRTSGELAREVIVGEPAAPTIAAHVRTYDDTNFAIVLLILPDFTGDARAFERFVEAVRTHDDPSSRFAMAPFHPQTSYATDTPSRLVGLFRRAPDPTIQLVRYAALEAAKKRAPDGKFYFDGSPAAWAALASRPERGLSDQITHDNFVRLKDGARALEEKLAAIADRRATG